MIEKIINEVYSNGYSITPDFFSKDEISSLIDSFNQKKDNIKKASIGNNNLKTINTDIRSDKIVWLDNNENTLAFFFGFINELTIQLNRKCFLGLNSNEFHFAVYNKGDFYKKHKDAFNNSSERKITIITYLNENWGDEDGGELVIYLDNKTLKIEPKAGTIVIFESFIEHEVLICNKDRVSLTGWLKCSKDLTLY
ncbi:MAG: 2OG-Fe(II) oxygenase [Bacteroidetes bacterium]|nr:2OG-Fe(II) oxygenase [Bacteroidota bacterium]